MKILEKEWKKCYFGRTNQFFFSVQFPWSSFLKKCEYCYGVVLLWNHQQILTVPLTWRLNIHIIVSQRLWGGRQQLWLGVRTEAAIWLARSIWWLMPKECSLIIFNRCLKWGINISVLANGLYIFAWEQNGEGGCCGYLKLSLISLKIYNSCAFFNAKEKV